MYKLTVTIYGNATLKNERSGEERAFLCEEHALRYLASLGVIHYVNKRLDELKYLEATKDRLLRDFNAAAYNSEIVSGETNEACRWFSDFQKANNPKTCIKFLEDAARRYANSAHTRVMCVDVARKMDYEEIRTYVGSFIWLYAETDDAETIDVLICAIDEWKATEFIAFLQTLKIKKESFLLERARQHAIKKLTEIRDRNNT